MSIELRKLTGDDLDAVFLWMKDPEAVRLAAFTAADPSDRAAFDSHRARIAADPTVLERAITSDGELVGTIASFMMEGDRELTYWVDPACWGRGIALSRSRAIPPVGADAAAVRPGCGAQPAVRSRRGARWVRCCRAR